LSVLILVSSLHFGLSAQDAYLTIKEPPTVSIGDCDICGDLKDVIPNKEKLSLFAAKLQTSIEDNNAMLEQEQAFLGLEKNEAALKTEIKSAKKSKDNKKLKTLNKDLSSLNKDLSKQEGNLKKSKDRLKRSTNKYIDAIYNYQDHTIAPGSPKKTLEGIITFAELCLSFAASEKDPFLKERKSESCELYPDIKSSLKSEHKCDKKSKKTKDADYEKNNKKICYTIRAIENKFYKILNKRGDKETADLL